MNECHKCKHFAETETEGRCTLLDSSCMTARATPKPVKVLEPGITLFKMIDGRCGMAGKLWEKKPQLGHKGLPLERFQ